MSDASQLAPGRVDTGPEAEASDEAAAPDPLVGQLVDSRYRVIERLAEGGMGTVYRAEHIALHKEVAIKLVQDSGNSDHAMRFLREAVLTSRIDHPNVISALDYGTFDQGAAYLVMSLVDGPTLAHVMKYDAPMSWLRAAEIGAQVADAVAAAQAQGIVHRDLKPENIVLQPMANGSVVIKVLDFGIAKYARDSLAPPQVLGAQRVTRLGVVVGTPGYMAPEQAVGMRADHRADLYAIGVMLWECVVGKRLWDYADVQQLVTAQLGSRPGLLRAETGDPTIPEAFEKLVAELLATRPERRPQSAIEARDRLRACIEEERRRLDAQVESAPGAEPGLGVIAPPPSTDTVFIDAAVAGWRGGARKPAPEAQAPAGVADEPPTTRFLRPAALDAAPQPVTQVGFRAAAFVAGVDDAPMALESSTADEAAVAEQDPARETALELAASPAIADVPAPTPAPDGSAEEPVELRTFARAHVAAGAALALLVVLWAAFALRPSPARPPSTGAVAASRPEPASSPGAALSHAPEPVTSATSATMPAAPAALPAAREPSHQSAPAAAARATTAIRAAASKKEGDAPSAAAARSDHERGSELRAQARAHFRQAKFDLAAQTYRRAIKAAPEYAGAYAGLGASQLALGDARGAIASYQQAVRRSPDSSGFHAALGRAYVMAREREQAVAEYRKAVALDPGNEIAVKALARLTGL